LSTGNSEVALPGGAVVTVKVSATARAMRLRVDPRTGGVWLTVPRLVSRRRAIEWAAGHRQWIEQALARVPARVPLTAGSAVPLYGLPHIIDWAPGRPRAIEVRDGRLMAGGPIEGLEARILRWLKRHALDTLARETRDCAAASGLRVARIGVGDPVSRWGSCASSGGIRYSWRLILAPEFVRLATVAHEVAHLVHMNHGPQFHALVETLLGGDPKPARLWLRRHGAELHRIGAS